MHSDQKTQFWKLGNGPRWKILAAQQNLGFFIKENLKITSKDRLLLRRARGSQP